MLGSTKLLFFYALELKTFWRPSLFLLAAACRRSWKVPPTDLPSPPAGLAETTRAGEALHRTLKGMCMDSDHNFIKYRD